MRNAMRAAVLVLAALMAIEPASAQTADEIIDKSIAAMGGRAALAKITSRVSTGTISLQTPVGDIPGTVEVMNAAPNKVRTLVKADLTSVGAGALEIDQRFDGENGYVLDSLQGNREMTGDLLQNMRNGSFPHGFLTYKEMGITARLKGTEKLANGEYHVIVFEPAKGAPITQYIDAKTLLPVRYTVRVTVPQMNTEVDQTTELDDFRDVDGIKVPFTVRSSSSVQSYVITFTNVAHNTAIDPKLFVKP
jgi:hypothetical protein